MIDIIDKPEQEKESKQNKVPDSFLDILSDVAEATLEIITNIIKD